MQTHFWRNDCFIRPNNCKQAIFLKDILGKLCFEWFPRAKKKVFWCSPSWAKSCSSSRSYFLVLSVRQKNRALALDRVFCCSLAQKVVLQIVSLLCALPVPKQMCSTSCFLDLSGVFPRAKNFVLNRALWCSPSSKKIVPQIVLFVALLRARNRARMGPPR